MIRPLLPGSAAELISTVMAPADWPPGTLGERHLDPVDTARQMVDVHVCAYRHRAEEHNASGR